MDVRRVRWCAEYRRIIVGGVFCSLFSRCMPTPICVCVLCEYKMSCIRHTHLLHTWEKSNLKIQNTIPKDSAEPFFIGFLRCAYTYRTRCTYTVVYFNVRLYAAAHSLRQTATVNTMTIRSRQWSLTFAILQYLRRVTYTRTPKTYV